MPETTVSEILAQHPFTHDLDQEERKALAGLATVRTYEPDDLLIREGRAADTFFVIVDGLVAIEMFLPDRGVRRLQTVEAGDVVGWSWIVPPYRWEFDVRALARTTAVVLDAARLRELLDRDEHLATRLFQKLLLVVAARLSATRLQLLDIYAPPAEVGR
ncbi:MAG: cyclic nucleotide-binding domain-containing protein [Chloroflexi bacterium]|nr:cyclic nucleotide-binding domain-containing protein [Chloroflexota bacterium]